ncbi:MAG: hypothetical protein IJU28_07810, partial [Clostridia bacterium]|nr:hypothetical protein [Clostridia bacterium]
MKKILSLALALVLLMSVFAFGATAEGGKKYADGTVLRMATGYNSTKTGLSLDAEVAGEGITLADGVTYHAGD